MKQAHDLHIKAPLMFTCIIVPIERCVILGYLSRQQPYMPGTRDLVTASTRLEPQQIVLSPHSQTPFCHIGLLASLK